MKFKFKNKDKLNYFIFIIIFISFLLFTKRIFNNKNTKRKGEYIPYMGSDQACLEHGIHCDIGYWCRDGSSCNSGYCDFTNPIIEGDFGGTCSEDKGDGKGQINQYILNTCKEDEYYDNGWCTKIKNIDENFTVGSQVNSSIEGGVGAQENYNSSILNLYGEPLQQCQTGSESGSSINGYCKEDTGGLHQICFKVDDYTKDFSLETGQSNWSEGRNGNHHCMCLGAWALYKAKNKGTDEELDCDAIPEYSLSTDYIGNWNTWNGNEYLESNGKPQDQIIDGVDSLVEQCYNKDDLSDDKKEYLRELYDNIRLSYENWNSKI